MNLKQLISQFDLVTDTEEGFEQLRKLILNLAVRGKLTEQNTQDEPAEALLANVQEKKHELYDDGEIRKPKKRKEIVEGEEPFSLLIDWEWSRIIDLGILQTGTTPKKSKSEYFGNYMPLIKPAQVDGGEVNYNGEGVSKLAIDEGKARLIPAKSILVVCIGTLGKTGYTLKPVSCNQQINTLTPLGGSNFKFLYYAFLSNIVQKQIEELSNATTISIINKTNWGKVKVPIPPKEEQQRIVQKIETLFSQVDELERKVRQDREVDERLQVAVLDDLQRAETPEASRQSWQRLTDHLNQIYRKPEHIDQLKQAILNEAVRGRLVPQDPNDEPAEKLLKRIKEEKQRLYGEGEIRKPKDLDPISKDEIPYELPEGWAWERLGNIKTEFIGGFAYKSKRFIENSEYQVIRLGNVKNEGLLLDRNPVFITEEYAKETEGYQLKVGDFLITMTGTNNKRDFCFTAIVESKDLDDRDLYLNQRVGCLRFHDRIFVDVIDEFLKSDFLLDPLFEAASGTANQANLSKTDLMNLLVPIPPKEEQERILQKVDNLFAWCDDLKEKLSRSQQTDQRLLEALVNGESSVEAN